MALTKEDKIGLGDHVLILDTDNEQKQKHKGEVGKVIKIMSLDLILDLVKGGTVVVEVNEVKKLTERQKEALGLVQSV